MTVCAATVSIGGVLAALTALALVVVVIAGLVLVPRLYVKAEKRRYVSSLDRGEVSPATHYYDPLGCWLLRAFSALYVLLAPVLFAPVPSYSTERGHPTEILLIRIGAGVGIAWSIFAWHLAGRLGVYVSADGIMIRNRFGLRRRRVSWGDIARFFPQASITPVVCTELRSGGRIRMPLVQGRKMRWQTGASRDIVAVLNADLARIGMASPIMDLASASQQAACREP